VREPEVASASVSAWVSVSVLVRVSVKETDRAPVEAGRA
jgi:hypothetical protein